MPVFDDLVERGHSIRLPLSHPDHGWRGNELGAHRRFVVAPFARCIREPCLNARRHVHRPHTGASAQRKQRFGHALERLDVCAILLDQGLGVVAALRYAHGLTPESEYLQASWTAHLPYRQATKMLKEMLPLGKGVSSSATRDGMMVAAVAK